MKATTPLIYTLLGLLLITACGKKEKKCSDSDATNYETSLDGNTESCIYPADIMAGTWQVTEHHTTINTIDTTSTFEAELVRVDNTGLRFEDKRTPKPSYTFDGSYLEVLWSANTLTGPNDKFFQGSVYGESDIAFSYALTYGGAIHHFQLTMIKLN